MLLCNSINSSDVMESSSESDLDSVDNLDSVSVFPLLTPAIKGLSLSEWVANLLRCPIVKDNLSGM